MCTSSDVDDIDFQRKKKKSVVVKSPAEKTVAGQMEGNMKAESRGRKKSGNEKIQKKTNTTDDDTQKSYESDSNDINVSS